MQSDTYGKLKCSLDALVLWKILEHNALRLLCILQISLLKFNYRVMYIDRSEIFHLSMYAVIMYVRMYVCMCEIMCSNVTSNSKFNLYNITHGHLQIQHTGYAVTMSQSLNVTVTEHSLI